MYRGIKDNHEETSVSIASLQAMGFGAFFTLKMTAARLSEMLVFYYITKWHHNPQSPQ
jgi:hypothetical protein